MRYTAQQYAQALYESTKNASDGDVDDLMRQFDALLERHEALHMKPSILKAYRAILITHNVLPEVTIVSAQEMSQRIQKDVLHQLEIADDISIKTKIDPDMIGGIYVTYNNRLFDLSLARKLARLKRHLEKRIA